MKKVLLAGLLTTSQAIAGVTIGNCVIVEPAPNVDRAALFFTADFVNDDAVKALRLPSPEAIMGGAVPALSANVQIHKTTMQDGIMTMQRIPNLTLQYDSQTVLKKGGLHFMLMDLKKRPLAGESYPVNIWLTYLGEISCTAKVVNAAQLGSQ